MIRIEVTGDSIPEVADKLTAMARALAVQVSYEADNAAREALQAQRDAAKPKPARKAKAAEEAKPEADAGEPQADEVAEEPTALAEPAAQTSSTKAAPSELDFDKDVAPVVLDAVAAIGKERVVGIIGEFGAARASEVSPAQWPELVERLKGEQA